jgi:hypothetical protein
LQSDPVVVANLFPPPHPPNAYLSDTQPLKHVSRGVSQAQTEAELTLPPGKHKLTLQFAKYDHSSYGKAYAKTINVTVK